VAGHGSDESRLCSTPSREMVHLADEIRHTIHIAWKWLFMDKNVSESLSFFFEVTSSREVPGDVGLPVLFNQVWKVGVGAVGECR